MKSKNKIIKKVSFSLLAVLLSGSANTAVVMADTIENNTTVSQKTVGTEEQLSQEVTPSENSVSKSAVKKTAVSENQATNTSQKNMLANSDVSQKTVGIEEQISQEVTPSENSSSKSEVTKTTVSKNQAINTSQENMLANSDLAGTEFDYENFSYRINDDGTSVTLIDYFGENTDVVVPSTVKYDSKDFLVTIIGDHAMSGFTHSIKLTSIILPEGLQKVEYCGLEDNHFTSVHLPSTLTTLDEKAFNNDYWASGSNGLLSVTGGNNLTNVSTLAFAGNQLTSTNFIPNSAIIANGALVNQTVSKTISNDNISLSDLLSTNFTISISDLTDGVIYSDETKMFSIPKDINSFSFNWSSENNQYSGTYNVTALHNLVEINYLDTDGKVLSPSEFLSGNVGEDYKSYTKNIEGYTLKEIQGNATGKFTDQAQTIVYIYTKNPVAGANITVNYEDVYGNKIDDSLVISGNVGDPYTTEQKTIKGYAFKSIEGNPTGHYTSDPQVVTYVYTKNGLTPTPTSTDSTTPQAGNDKQLPATGDNQASSLAMLIMGIVALLISMTFVGLRIKHNRSTK